jgi:hypothetical protein
MRMSRGPLETTCVSCGILGLIKITPEKKKADEQIDMPTWDRKRRKMGNLQMANLLSKKPKKHHR